MWAELNFFLAESSMVTELVRAVDCFQDYCQEPIKLEVLATEAAVDVDPFNCFRILWSSSAFCIYNGVHNNVAVTYGNLI